MGDYSNIKFRKEENYTSVNSQQGKVQLDSDINEQNDINRYLQRTTLNDVVGKYGTPSENPGCEIIPNDKPLAEFKNIPGKDSLKLAEFIQNNFGIVLMPYELSSKLRSFDGYSENHDQEDEEYDEEIISLASTIFEVEVGPESISLNAQSIDGLHQLEMKVGQEDETCVLSIDSESVYEFLVGRDEDDGQPAKIFTRSFRIGRGNYYVNGTLCQNFKEIESTRQPSLPSLYGSKVYIFNWKNIVADTEDKNNGDYYNIIRFLENFGIEWLLDDPNKDITSYFTSSESEIKITSTIDVNKHVSFKRASDTSNVTLECSEPEFSFDNFIIVKNDENDQNDVQIYYDGIHTAAFPVSLNVKENSYFIAYLDVWDRDISSIEDPSILETALGGIETTTRTKTISQVKLLPIKDIYSLCDRVFVWPSSNTSVRLQIDGLLIFLEQYFYVRAESRLYDFFFPNNLNIEHLRQFFDFDSEILKPKLDVFNVSFHIRMDASNKLAHLYINDKLVTEFIIREENGDIVLYHINKNLINGFWEDFLLKHSHKNNIKIKIKERIEPDLCNLSGDLTEINKTKEGNHFYKLQVNDPGYDGQAVFKYSVNNGYMKTQVLRIEKINPSESRITIGRNTFGSNINSGNSYWVEISDDRRDLSNIPGSFVQLRKEKNDFSFVFNHEDVRGDPINTETYPLQFNPKLIYWNKDESFLKINTTNDTISLAEDGIEIKLIDSFYYNTFDYWNFAIRNGILEFPVIHQEYADGDTSKVLIPTGIYHKYAYLGLLRYNRVEKKFHFLKDLRIFLQSQIDSKITSGLITLLIKPFLRITNDRQPSRWIVPSVYGPFKHYFNNVLNPPNIVLSLEQVFPFFKVNGNNYLEKLEDYLSSQDSSILMEDQVLLGNVVNDPIIDNSKIKAFGINDETFLIKFRNSILDDVVNTAEGDIHRRGYLVKVRWTAVKGLEKSPQTNIANPLIHYDIIIQEQRSLINGPLTNDEVIFDISDSDLIPSPFSILVRLDYDILNLILEGSQNVFSDVNFYLPNRTQFSSERVILKKLENSSKYEGRLNFSYDNSNGYSLSNSPHDWNDFFKNGSFIIINYVYLDHNLIKRKVLEKTIVLKKSV